VRDSLIGLAPLIAGTLLIAYVGVYQMQLDTLWDVFRNGQYGLFWMGVGLVPSIPDFYLWFYLIFAVSSTMLPSESDRHSWLPLGIWLGVLLAIALFAGAGGWMLTNLAPVLDNFLLSVALLFGVSNIVHIILLIPFWALHRVISYILQVDVQKR